METDCTSSRNEKLEIVRVNEKPLNDAIKNQENFQSENVEGQKAQEKIILSDSSAEDIAEEEDPTSKTMMITKICPPPAAKEPSVTSNSQEISQLSLQQFEENFILPDELPDSFTESICEGEGAVPRTEEVKPRRKTKPRPPPKEKFQCSVCSLGFTRKYQLKRHMEMTICSGQPSPGYTCVVCGKVYRRKDNLTVHLRSHTGEPRYVRKMNHTCSYCGKQYHHIATFEIHVRKHTGEKPFPCDLCEKRFPSNGQLTVHFRKHTGEKPYSCKECGKRFAQNSSLKRHLLRRCNMPTPRKLICYTELHLEENVNSNEKLADENVPNDDSSASASEHNNGFVCGRCRKNFDSIETLQKHNCTTLEPNSPFSDNKKDSKPHQCPICFKGFTRKSSLTTHILTHNKEKTCSCNQCGRAFLRKDSLTRHLAKTCCQSETILPD